MPRFDPATLEFVDRLTLTDEHVAHLREWIAALRSGSYTQGKGALRTRDRHTGQLHYCCLGVGCDTFDPTAWYDTPPSETGLSEVFRFGSREVSSPEKSSCSALTAKAQDHFGLTHSGALNISTPDGRSTFDFIYLNDVADFTFEDIATTLERAIATFRPDLTAERTPHAP